MEKLPQATLKETEVRYIKSSYVVQEYEIFIAYPKSYANQEAKDKKFPVIYLLDANWYFGTICETTRLFSFCGSIPEVIIVGIGYPVSPMLEKSILEVYGLRGRDLTPAIDKTWEEENREEMGMDFIGSGGAEPFLNFLENELIPLVDSEYRTDSTKRIIAGFSLGALFVIYTMLAKPKLFFGYIASSPSLWFKDRFIFSIEENYAQNHKDLQSNLYISVGQNEEDSESGMVSNMFQLTAKIESREYESLRIKNHLFENLDHCESGMPGIQYGIKWVFS